MTINSFNIISLTHTQVSKWGVAFLPGQAEEFLGLAYKRRCDEENTMTHVSPETAKLDLAVREILRWRTIFGASVCVVAVALPISAAAPSGALLSLVAKSLLVTSSSLLVTSAAKLYALACKIPTFYPRAS
ncbi:MAG: hypothetical protein ACHQT8_06340 [Chlamydiales bacterium]